MLWNTKFYFIRFQITFELWSKIVAGLACDPIEMARDTCETCWSRIASATVLAMKETEETDQSIFTEFIDD